MLDRYRKTIVPKKWLLQWVLDKNLLRFCSRRGRGNSRQLFMRIRNGELPTDLDAIVLLALALERVVAGPTRLALDIECTCITVPVAIRGCATGMTG